MESSYLAFFGPMTDCHVTVSSVPFDWLCIWLVKRIGYFPWYYKTKRKALFEFRWSKAWKKSMNSVVEILKRLSTTSIFCWSSVADVHLLHSWTFSLQPILSRLTFSISPAPIPYFGKLILKFFSKSNVLLRFAFIQTIGNVKLN